MHQHRPQALGICTIMECLNIMCSSLQPVGNRDEHKPKGSLDACMRCRPECGAMRSTHSALEHPRTDLLRTFENVLYNSFREDAKATGQPLLVAADAASLPRLLQQLAESSVLEEPHRASERFRLIVFCDVLEVQVL